MRYRYEALDPGSFQRLVQAILAREIGPEFRALPIGQADGGRDGLADARVFQVKHTVKEIPSGSTAKWLEGAFEEEYDKIRRLVSRGLTKYFLVTNVEGSGNLDTGSRDKVDAWLEARRRDLGLDTITVWWRSDLDARFASAEISLKMAFLRVLPGDEALAITSLHQRDSQSRSDKALLAYISQQFELDESVRFEQVDLSGPSVQSMFVDVPVTYQVGDSAVARITRLLDSDPDDYPGELEEEAPRLIGGARLLLSDVWFGNAVLIGGPGQGKSTLLQYICQAHRAQHLGEIEYLRGVVTAPTVARVVFRIDLRDFAQWMTDVGKANRKRRPDKQAPIALERFLVGHVANRCGGNRFTAQDLVRVFADRPTLLALDGLDEVADLNQRDEVAQEIGSAVARLQADAADLMVLVSTRPGSSSAIDRLGHSFPHFFMQPLSPALRLAYLERWATQANLGVQQKASLRSTFEAKQEIPHVRELAASPMQLAILLHLMQRRGILPENRTDLYADYMKVFLDRESPKEPVVRDHRALVEEVHSFVGWHLQAKAETDGTAGRIGIDELRSLLARLLRHHGLGGELVTQLFNSVTARVLCLVQRVQGQFQFEVQPLREYFAAKYILDGAPFSRDGVSKDERLIELLKRPYWSNVMRFYAGMLSTGEVKGLPSTLRSLRQVHPYNVLPQTRSAALQLVGDQLFVRPGQLHLQEAIDSALDGPGIALAYRGFLTDAAIHFQLDEGAGLEQVADHLRRRLRYLQGEPLSRVPAIAAVFAMHSSNPIRAQFIWSDEVRTATREWLTAAAYCSALDGLNRDNAEHVLQCSHEFSPEGAEFLAVMLQSGSDCYDSSVLSRVMLDCAQNNSAKDGVSLSKHLLPIEALYNSTSAARFYPSSRSQSSLRTTSEIRSAAKILSSDEDRWIPLIGQLVELERQNAGGELDDHQFCLRRLELLFESTGDCWLMREGVVASQLFRSDPMDRLGSEQSSLSQYSQWVEGARERHEDVASWTSVINDSNDAIDWMTAVSLVLTFASSAQVYDLLPTIDDRLTVLSSDRFTALVGSLRRLARERAARRLGLRELIRTGAYSPSLKVTLLVAPHSNDTTREYLARAAWNQNRTIDEPHVARLARQLLGDHISRRLSWTSDARNDPGLRASIAFHSNVRFKKPTKADAVEILENPELFAGEGVNAAIERAEEPLSRLTPLLRLAESQSWFPEV